MRQDVDVLIVGAGVGGGSAAILLARAGWSVALVEKRAFPRRKVCGECVAASNLPLLDAMGVGEAFDQRAGPALRRTGLFVGEERIIAPLPRMSHPVHGYGRALGREHLDTLLRDRAVELGVTLLQPWNVRVVHSGREGHRCELRHVGTGETKSLSARILVDAHGSWEPDLRSADNQSPRARPLPRDGDLLAFKGTFAGSDLDPGLLPVLAFPGGYGGMVIAEDGLLTLACCMRRDTLHSIRAEMQGEKAARAVQAYLEEQCIGVRDALRGTHAADAWLSAGPIRPGLRAPAPACNQFAIGNAAGEAHPILGEGMSMAIQSAWLLCERLEAHRDALMRGDDGAQIAHEYTRQWRRAFTTRIRAAAVLSHLAMQPAAARAWRPLLRRWPAILTLSARIGGKTRSAIDPAGLHRVVAAA